MNIKKDIISIINTEINNMDGLTIEYIKNKNQWVYHDIYWSNMLTLSLSKDKKKYWIDSSICFRWYFNMQFIHLSFSLSMNEEKVISDRETIEIDYYNSENATILIKQTLNNLLYFSKRNTIEYVNNHYFIKHYDYNDTRQNIDKAMLCFLSNDFKHGNEFLSRAKDCYQNNSTMDSISYIDTHLDHKNFKSLVEDLCRKNISLFR